MYWLACKTATLTSIQHTVGGTLCIEMRFYVDLSRDSRYNSEIKFDKNKLRLQFICCILIPAQNVHVNPHFYTQWGGWGGRLP